MTVLTLLTKINHDFQLKQVGKALMPLLKGLEVNAKILGTVADGWVQIDLAGEDEGVVTNYLIKEVGLCPSSFESVRKFSKLKINNRVRKMCIIPRQLKKTKFPMTRSDTFARRGGGQDDLENRQSVFLIQII